MRGMRSRPCLKEPRFPKFHEYELVLWPTATVCTAATREERPEAVREVDLLAGFGDTPEEVARRVERSYIRARDRYVAARDWSKE